MADNIFHFECAMDDFAVESDDKEEVIEMAKIHAKKRDDKEVSKEEIEKDVTEI